MEVTQEVLLENEILQACKTISRNAMNGMRNSYGPTGVHRKSYETAKEILCYNKSEGESSLCFYIAN